MLRGPFALRSRRARALALLVIVLLTLLTQLGGVVLWPLVGLGVSLSPQARWALVPVSVLGWVLFGAFAVPLLAALAGRTPLPCTPDGALAPRSIVFCLGLRNYVRSDLRDEALAIAEDVRAGDPSAQVRYLDGAFPLGPYFPILPHLSHGDGRRLDIALVFEDGTGSPLGYFGYAPLDPDEQPACPSQWLDRRWDLDALQPLFGPPRLDVSRSSRILRAAIARPRITRVLLEPHVSHELGVRATKLVFQGCRAARHDDHMHVEVAP